MEDALPMPDKDRLRKRPRDPRHPIRLQGRKLPVRPQRPGHQQHRTQQRLIRQPVQPRRRVLHLTLPRMRPLTRNRIASKVCGR